MKVMLCCRDERGGWTERVVAVEFGRCEARVNVWPFESVGDINDFDGVPLLVCGDGIVVGWRWFPAIKRRRMVGNCMWDSVEMDKLTATKLFVYLAILGGDVEVAPAEWFERFKRIRNKAWRAKVADGEGKA